MSKILKNTATFFLWLACLVLFAHQVLPHDHHSEICISSESDDCLSNQNESNNHHSENQTHCHTLNDIAFEKLVPALNFCPNLPVFNLLSFEIRNQETFVSTLTINRFIRQKEKPSDPVFLNSSSLRAPPALA